VLSQISVPKFSSIVTFIGMVINIILLTSTLMKYHSGDQIENDEIDRGV
jgi:hypothetical protein